MHRYFIKLAFQGTNYHGWQIQSEARSVQEVLNHALSTIFRQNIQVIGAGRTDAGVHASCFYAHFDMDADPQPDMQNAIFRLNRFLPHDIAIYAITPVKDKSHARFDAISRTYRYQVTTLKDPFRTAFAYHFFKEPDMDKMNRAAEIIAEYKDFTSFSKSRTQVKTHICEIYHAGWYKQKHLLCFTVKANRFLRNMVRAMVGTLLEIGTGKIEVNKLRDILESKNRSAAGYSVPPNGLFLDHIEYPKDIFLPEE
jgi:tRNA pseudouridine38-40 synthase